MKARLFMLFGGAMVIAAAVVVSIVAAGRMAKEHAGISAKFQKPKIFAVRIDGNPITLGPEASVTVMEATKVSVRCEIVKPQGAFSFALTSAGEEQRAGDCDFLAPAPRLDQLGPVTVALLDGGGRKLDATSVVLKGIRSGERAFIHNLGTTDGQFLSGATAPLSAKVYAKAIMRNMPEKESKKLRGLFFVSPADSSGMVLQVVIDEKAANPVRANEGRLARYRDFGPDHGGYAFWSEAPIQIGMPEDSHKLYYLYVGVYDAEGEAKVLDLALGGRGQPRTSEDGGTVTIEAVSRLGAEAAAKLAFCGLLSAALPVVRQLDGAGSGEAQRVRVTQPAQEGVVP